MPEREKAPHKIESAPVVNLDRVCIAASASDRKAFLKQPRHRVWRSHFLRSSAYQRLLETESTDTGAFTIFYDMPRVPWVPEARVVLRAGDLQGLAPTDLLGAFELLVNGRLTMVELALDFTDQADLNIGFIAKHLVVGKSRWAGRQPGILWFGARRSSKFVRAYSKPSLHVFRVELEFHPAWLRRHRIYDCFDFHRIPNLVARRHILFCALDWDSVKRRIRKTVPNPRRALEILTWQQHDLHATLRFLRRELRLTNTHRFLLPLELNDSVASALKSWADQWPKRPFGFQRSGEIAQ